MSEVILENFTGGTQLNPTVKTYESLITRIKHHLGYPLVQVEVSDEQIVDFINESIEFFTKFAGYTEEFLVFDTKVYEAGKGVNVEKLINSTCIYTTSTTNTKTVDVVNIPLNSYYFFTSSTPAYTIYKTTSSDSLLTSNQSFKGTPIYNNTLSAVPISLTLSTVYVDVQPATYYISENNLFQSGSAVTNFTSTTGSLIQEGISTFEISSIQTSITSVDLVFLSEGTYYTHNNALYRSGSSADTILSDTFYKGDIVQDNIQNLAVSTYNTFYTASVVDVAPDRYYVNGNNLWKSSHNLSPNGLAFMGSMILQDLPVLSITSLLTNRQVNLVNLPANTYYTYQNQIWQSGSEVSTGSLKGVMINNSLIQLLPEVHSFNGVDHTLVPVASNTVYFNCNYEPPMLFRSGSATENILQGYSEEGSIEQETVTQSTPFSAIISVTVDAVEYNKTDSLYLNGTTIWKTGARLDNNYIEAGVVFASNISLGVAFQEEVIDCEVPVVNIEAEQYYISENALYISCSSEELLPAGYSAHGNKIQNFIEGVEYFVQGAIPGPVFNVVNVQPNTYYTNNNRLIQSGDIYNGNWSLSGTIIQQNINNVNINIDTTVVEVVSTQSNTHYIYNDTLYYSGSSTDSILANTSVVDSSSGVNLYKDIVSESVTRTESINMFYDYDLLSYRKVIDCFSYEAGESTGINTLFTLEQAMAQQIYSSYMIGNFGFDLVTWEVLKGFIDTRNKVLAQKQHFRFDNRSQLLRITPEPRLEESYFGIVGCYIERPIKDLIRERWVYEYARALTMISVGNVRGKYSGTGLFGGGQVNGNDLRQQGITEKENLEKRLRTEYEDNMPPMFFVG